MTVSGLKPIYMYIYSILSLESNWGISHGCYPLTNSGLDPQEKVFHDSLERFVDWG